MAREGTSRVLVTSGPTRAYLDRIRYIANASSGALGANIAEQLMNRGIPVRLLLGEGAVRPQAPNPELLEINPVITVEDLVVEIRRASARSEFKAVIHAMAVLDYAPEQSFPGKRRSDTEDWVIRLVKTPKVIGMLKKLFPEAFLVGFKLESGASEQDLIGSARKLLEQNSLDLVVANDIERVSADRHEAIIVDAAGQILERPSTKQEIAETLAGIVSKRIG